MSVPAPQLLSPTAKRTVYKTVGAVLIISLIVKLCGWAVAFYNGGDLWHGYSIADYLINLRGGFVRRGLYGELLLRFSELTGLSPLAVLAPVCIGAYVFTFWFLLRGCGRLDARWWIVLTPLLCGFTDYFERKDFLLYALLTCTLVLLRKMEPGRASRLLTAILVMAGLFIHEAYFFWGVPVVALVMLGQRRGLAEAAVSAAVVLTFGVLCLNKGDGNAAQAIYDSWRGIIDLPADWRDCGALEALRWDLFGTFRYHFTSNFHTGEFSWLVFVPRLFTMVFAYILLTNYFSLFSADKEASGATGRQTVSSLFIMTLLCMSPMFLLLSNDWGRLYQYLAMATVTTFFVFPAGRLCGYMPGWLLRLADRVNALLGAVFVPTRGLLIVLILFIGISPFDFNPAAAFQESAVGSVLRAILDLIYIAAH